MRGDIEAFVAGSGHTCLRFAHDIAKTEMSQVVQRRNQYGIDPRDPPRMSRRDGRLAASRA